MSRFDDLEKGPVKPKAVPFHREVEMYLDCNMCDEEVELAKYFPNENLLIWECSKGHKSIIEGFNLDTSVY